MTSREKAVEHFKRIREMFYEYYLKFWPKNSIGYQATLKEKEFYDMAIEVLEQEPCKDVISRQAAIDAMIKLENNDIAQYGCSIREGFNSSVAIEALNKLPPVTQKSETELVADRCRECAVSSATQLLKYMKQYHQWMPCSEKMPKAGEYVGDAPKYYLVQNKYGDMMVARYTHSEYWEQKNKLNPIADEIVAWCELPAQYRTESEV